MRPIAAQLGVDHFEAANEIEHIAAGVRATGRGAKVGAAAEGAAFVDQAAAGGIQERASAILPFGETGAAGSAQRFGGDQGFSLGELRDAAREMKLAASRAAFTGTLHGPGREIGIYRADFGEGLPIVGDAAFYRRAS